MPYGTKTIMNSGRAVPASADGVPRYKVGGVTLDWTTFPAAPVADTTLAYDDTIVPAGVQYAPGGCIFAEITATGKYGPYDAGAGDGRQTLARGKCFILNFTLLKTDPHSDYAPGVFDAGRVYVNRVKNVVGGAFATTWNATIAAAFPGLQLVY